LKWKNIKHILNSVRSSFFVLPFHFDYCSHFTCTPAIIPKSSSKTSHFHLNRRKLRKTKWHAYSIHWWIIFKYFILLGYYLLKGIILLVKLDLMDSIWAGHKKVMSFTSCLFSHSSPCHDEFLNYESIFRSSLSRRTKVEA